MVGCKQKFNPFSLIGSPIPCPKYLTLIPYSYLSTKKVSHLKYFNHLYIIKTSNIYLYANLVKRVNYVNVNL